MALKITFFALSLFLPCLGWGGDWHVTGSLPCTDCHLQHGTDDNQGYIGPYTFLLRKNSVNELCLSCHDGTDATAPDVLAPVGMYDATPSQQSAAGFMVTTGINNPNGHTLGLPLPVPYQTNPKTVELNCISCHAPHGNKNYCNLLPDPGETGTEIDLVVGIHIFQERAPDQPPTPTGSSVAYSRSNIAYGAGLSNWCTSCHEQLSASGSAPPPAHFNAHPVDVAMNQFGMSAHTDGPHWLAGNGEGFVTEGAVSIPRVPFQSRNAADFRAAHTPALSDEVSCQSCHKAHGSANQKAMIWPYREGGDAYLSGCQQCHNK